MDAGRLTTLDARAICVIKPSALGDVVQTLPLLPLLRSRFPQARITWVINHAFRGLLEDYPLIDELVSYHRRGSVREFWSMARQLRRGRYDLVLDLQGLARSALMALATGSRCVIGLETAREGASLICHHTLPGTTRQVPAWQRYELVASALGCQWQERQVAFTTRELTGPANQLSDKGALVGMQLGAMWETKRWPPEKFAQVAARVLEQSAATIALLGSVADRSLVCTFQQEMARLGESRFVSRVVDLCGQTSLAELPTVLRSLDVLVTNDTGPMHLADVLDIPIVGLFTCTDPVRSGPRPGPDRTLFYADVSCHGSYCKTCPQKHNLRHACFDTLEIEQIATAVLATLHRPSKPVASSDTHGASLTTGNFLS